MIENKIFHGGCLCGDVTYSSEFNHTDMWNCHCNFCRKASGVAYATWIKTAPSAFRWLTEKTPRTHYKTSDNVVRSFCSRCGTVLPAHDEKEDSIYLPASGISTEHNLTPSSDLFSDEMPSWYHMNNHQPCHTSVDKEKLTSDIKNEGSCLCGSIKYRITGEVDAIRGCHCSRCRKRSGSSFFAAMPVLFTDFHIDGDKNNMTSFFLPESQYYGYSFCKCCGTVMPGIFPDGKRTVIAAGSLDTKPPVPLMYHIYYGSKAPWLHIEKNMKCFNEHPPLNYDWRI